VCRRKALSNFFKKGGCLDHLQAMPINNAAVEQDIAAAEERLKSLSVLCGILSGRVEASRRDLCQIRANIRSSDIRPQCETVAVPQSREQAGHATPGSISPDMLLG